MDTAYLERYSHRITRLIVILCELVTGLIPLAAIANLGIPTRDPPRHKKRRSY